MPPSNAVKRSVSAYAEIALIKLPLDVSRHIFVLPMSVHSLRERVALVKKLVQALESICRFAAERGSRLQLTSEPPGAQLCRQA